TLPLPNSKTHTHPGHNSSTSSFTITNEAKLRFSVEYNNSIGAFLVGTYCAMSFPYSKKNRKGYVAFLFLFFLFYFIAISPVSR
uniref:hypothetical protein n=1 Tax=Alloprevotella sp. TaxID=1872471 RepID=UPI003FEE8838